MAPLVPGDDENLASKVRFLSQNDLLCLVNMITSRLLPNREETLGQRRQGGAVAPPQAPPKEKEKKKKKKKREKKKKVKEKRKKEKKRTMKQRQITI